MLAAQVIWGLGATFISGALEAWIADEVGEERAGHAYLNFRSWRSKDLFHEFVIVSECHEWRVKGPSGWVLTCFRGVWGA